jgi:hypothetical protein
VAQQSHPYPIGAVRYGADRVAILSHLVLSDDLLKDPNFTCKPGFDFKPIQLIDPQWHIDKAIYETLLIIDKKEEE